MSCTVATYNILANAYIRPAWYPHTPSWMLVAAQRGPALVRHIIGLAADILCLQEVADGMFAALEEGLRPCGYTGHLTKKANGKPDGCAMFFRTRVFAALDIARVEYLDGSEGHAHSGHIAQLVILQHAHRTLGIANTHLKWDPPGTPREEQYGYRQVIQLLDACDAHAPVGTAWIVCGDLNATPESNVVATLQRAGFACTHQACPRAYTCNSNARAKTIDYVLHNAALRSQPATLPTVDDHTPLPGPEQPSDHVAVVARFEAISGKDSPASIPSPLTGEGEGGGEREAQGMDRRP